MAITNPVASWGRAAKMFRGPGDEVDLSHYDETLAATIIATSVNLRLRTSASSARWSGAELIEGIGIVSPPSIEQLDRLNETHAQLG